MSIAQRKAIRIALVSVAKQSSKKAAVTERSIYNMCGILTEEYDDGLEAIYGKMAYEKIGQMVAHPELLSKILKDISHVILNWNSAVYAEYRAREDKDTAEHAAGMKVTKGEFVCHNRLCGSDECYYYQDQTRSSDEGSTTYVVCTKCGDRYSFN